MIVPNPEPILDVYAIIANLLVHTFLSDIDEITCLVNVLNLVKIIMMGEVMNVVRNVIHFLVISLDNPPVDIFVLMIGNRVTTFEPLPSWEPVVAPETETFGGVGGW